MILWQYRGQVSVPPPPSACKVLATAYLIFFSIMAWGFWCSYNNSIHPKLSPAPYFSRFSFSNSLDFPPSSPSPSSSSCPPSPIPPPPPPPSQYHLFPVPFCSAFGCFSEYNANNFFLLFAFFKSIAILALHACVLNFYSLGGSYSFFLKAMYQTIHTCRNAKVCVLIACCCISYLFL